MIIDEYPFLDAVYQTVFTLTTVGYQETHPISDPGKLFVILLIFGGVMVWSYAIGVTISAVVSEDLVGKIQEAIMEHRIKNYRRHFIIVGYTDIARHVIRMLLRRGIPFVVIDDDQERLNHAEQDHVSEVLPLNPFLNDSFRRASVDKSRGIISTFPDDSDNITAVVTGKIMEEEIKRRFLMITVASHQEARTKLIKVGADVVILPNELIGQRISALALHPPSAEQSSVLDRVAFGEFNNLDIREVVIAENSTLAGVRLIDSGIRKDIGVHILGIQRRGKRRLMLMPSPEMHIHVGDKVLIMGTLPQLKLLPAYLGMEQTEEESATIMG
ncbi:MAG: potassium channel protein [Magnetococcales bacterium]|nr:potassium channel protein [Magnetococcales bacterium]